MPELPEIEVAKKGLDRLLTGKKIKEVSGDVPKMVSPRFPGFAEKLKNKRIKGIDRRAKVLIFQLSDEKCLIMHLKLTGQLVYQKKGQRLKMFGHPMEYVDKVPNKFTHLLLNWENNEK